MKRIDAVKVILKTVDKDAPALFTTGYTSREAAHICDREVNFYMMGSMGLLSALGAGLAFALPDKKIYIVEGDGSAYMSLGNLAVIGSFAFDNIVHIVLDNNVYGSTGDQRCVSTEVDIGKIAKACGYRKVYSVKKTGELGKVINRSGREKGPLFVKVEVEKAYDRDIPRVSLSPAGITKRFKEAIR